MPHKEAEKDERVKLHIPALLLSLPIRSSPERGFCDGVGHVAEGGEENGGGSWVEVLNVILLVRLPTPSLSRSHVLEVELGGGEEVEGLANGLVQLSQGKMEFVILHYAFV